MSEDLVTVASFSNPVLAHIVKGLLESERIQCFLANEKMFGLDPGAVWADRGVKIQVRESDAPRARAIIEEAQEEVEPPPS